MRKSHKRLITSVLTVSILTSFNIPKITLADQVEDGSIAIDAENFPDLNFQNYVKKFDENGDSNLNQDEIAEVKSIVVKNMEITNLKGVEYFTNIIYLNAENNKIETVDLSKNKNLKAIYFGNNLLTSIQLPNTEENNTLNILNVATNKLESINLHNLKSLTFVNVGNNELTTLDLGDNPLTDGYGFTADYNRITQIILPDNMTNYPWTEFLATQKYPKDKNAGYKASWYLDENKTQALNPNTTKTIRCVGQTLYTDYVPITYKVEFNPGTTSGETYTQDFKYDESKALSKNTFTKKGYEFVGWRDEAGRIYLDGEEVVNLSETDGQVIKLTAIWKEINYIGKTYKINLYNGEELIDTIEGTYGSSVEIPKNEIVKEGFDFAGWNFGNGEDVFYYDGGTVLFNNPDDLVGKEEGALDLHAVWKKGMKDSTVTIAQDSLDKVYDGKIMLDPYIEHSGSTSKVRFDWYKKENSQWVKLESAPSNVGKYKVVVTLPSDGEYKVASTEKEFEITKAKNSWETNPSIEGWIEGEAPKAPVGGNVFGDVKFTYSDSKDGIFTETIPTEAGTWYMKATVEGNENYDGLEKVVSFVIEKADTDNGGNVSKPQVSVLAGAKRYDTAVELSKSKFDKADTVVITEAYTIVDGITATPIATSCNSPILLVEKNNIPEVTKNEIERLGAKNVIIVGGTGAINTEVEKQLLSLGVSNITRLGGKDRYETSLLVAQYIDSNLYDVENIVVANGLGEADALSISPVAGRDKMPIILTRSNSIPTSIQNWLSGEEIKDAYIVGGKGAINDDVLNEVNKITSNDISNNRLGGSTRYETNALIVDKFYGESINKVYVSKGLELIDALSAGPIAALENSPVILSEKNLTEGQKNTLSKKNTNSVVQVGYGISNNVVESLRDLLSSK